MKRLGFRLAYSGAFAALALGFVSMAAASEITPFAADARSHWAFQKISRPLAPVPQHSEAARNPIDLFVLSSLEARHLALSAEADKVTLLRRTCLDVIGLPPSPEEVDLFLQDRSVVAFEKVVDRLLASPAYGERWARHWLDLARYAESEGFKEDGHRPNIWRYRDYVIRSLNSDKPYDRFVREQIAGDEFWPEDPDARIATGFNRHYPDEHNARNLRQRRQEILNDITDTAASVFMGLTVGCARCHDHKFDPILQTDYYRFQAFFANVAAADNMPLLSRGELAKYNGRLTNWEQKTKALREEMAAIEAPERKKLEDELFEKYPAEIQDAVRKAPEERNSFEWLMYYKAKQYLDPTSYQYVASTSAVAGKLKGEQKTRWEKLNEKLQSFRHLHPGPLPMASGITDVSATAPPTHLLNRGVYDKPREEVAPGFLQALDHAPCRIEAPPGLNSTGRRKALADLLVHPQNPLTARVIVNRIWQYHFGRGLVATASDFGLKGEPPSHPELLDWLASEFIASGWSMKHLHRLILTSATYRQASTFKQECAAVDPENKLLWRYPRQRLEGEVIRDAGLAVAGLLNPKMSGPSIWPELPAGMPSRGGWKTTKDEPECNRRSIYVVVKRNTRYPMFESFDMPDTHESCSRRSVTTSPVQALTMLNSELTLQWAKHFAARVVGSAGSNAHKQIDTAFRMAYSRYPDAKERDLALDFLAKQSAITGDGLADLCHMLINANEFVYRN